MLPVPVVPEEALEPPLAPMVLPLPEGEAEEPEALVDGEVVVPEEPAVEPEVDGEVDEPALEPLAPIDVPLLLGVLVDDELLLLGLVVLEPEAPMVLVCGEEGLAPPAAAPGPEALLVPDVVPALVVPPLALVPPALPAVPELWATAKPPKARAAAAATVVRVVLIMSLAP